MNFLILIFASLVSASALELPKDFEASKSFESSTKFWIAPKTLETVYVSDDVEDEVASEDVTLKAIKEVATAKKNALEGVMNIKDWKIAHSDEIKANTGSRMIILYGSYIDSSEQLTQFAEVYRLPKGGKVESLLFTRPKTSPWTTRELASRFKLEP